MSRSQRHMREVYEGGSAVDVTGMSVSSLNALQPLVATSAAKTREQTTGTNRVADTAPVRALTAVNQTVARNVALTPYQFASGLFTDADSGGGDTLTYAATDNNNRPIPAWLTFTPGTRTFSGTPALKDVGVRTIKIWAVDRAGKFATATFTMTVT